jgi:hypothetical protein
LPNPFWPVFLCRPQHRMDRIPAPPPPAKPRNESMNANTPGYRNRPNASANPMSRRFFPRIFL